MQVRLGSQRLPRKALLPLGGTTLIEQVMRALDEVPADARALLTDAASLPDLVGCARRAGWEIHEGPDVDVLERYRAAAAHHDVDTVLRATGDNPLVSPGLARSILAEHERAGADLSHWLDCPLGTGVEVLSRLALERAALHAAPGASREHITTWLYLHREALRIHEPRVSPEKAYPEATVSVDSAEDYERVRDIYGALYRGGPIDVEPVVDWLRRNPDRVARMRIVYRETR